MRASSLVLALVLERENLLVLYYACSTWVSYRKVADEKSHTGVSTDCSAQSLASDFDVESKRKKETLGKTTYLWRKHDVSGLYLHMR